VPTSCVRAFLVTAVFAALSCGPLAADAAARTVPMSVDRMAGHAHRVVVAQVTSVQPRTDAAQGVVTEVELLTERLLKGVAPAAFTLVVPGGTVGEITVWVSDTPAMAVGERVVLFLDASDRVVAGEHGCLRVRKDRVAGTDHTLAQLEARLAAVAIDPARRPALPEVFRRGATPAPTAQEAPAGTVALPLVTEISPDAVAAGTGSVITITGTGFGPVPGRVEFFYREGRPAVVASGPLLRQWSDTLIVAEVPVASVEGYPASPGTGPVRVVTATGMPSVGTELRVTFGYGSARWPDGDVMYYVNTNTADTTDELAMVQAAAATWSEQGSFGLVYGGPSEQTVASQALFNGSNDVFWADLPAGVLGQARRLQYAGELVECDFAFARDVVVDGTRRPWGDGSEGTYDVQSTALHELGHWLSLRDQYGDGDADEVMYGWGMLGERKRELHPYDAMGLSWIYDRTGDFTPPVTSAAGVPVAWSRSDVNVALSATDDDSGVARTYYRVDSEPVEVYATPIAFQTEGVRSLVYWSVDTSGNVEPATIVPVRIDRTPPVSNATVRPAYVRQASFEISADDDLSGVAEVRCSIDGGPERAGPTVSVSGTGRHSVTYFAVDEAGNAESPRAYEFDIVDPPPVVRVAGDTRFETSVRISQHNFADGSVNTVVLAAGNGYADALAASGLAGCLRSPVLLTRPDSLPAQVADELRRLGASRVIVIGGPAAVGDAVFAALSSQGLRAERIGGIDRYDTAARVARRIAAITGNDSSATAFLARGDSYADALAAAPLAYSLSAPVLLTRPNALPATAGDAARAVGIAHLVVAGGVAAVSDDVASSFGVPFTRAAGPDRYGTAAELATLAIEQGWCTPSVAGVTTGRDFPDALSGGAAMGARDGIILLTPGGRLSKSAGNALATCGLTLSEVQVLGGTGAVGEAVPGEIAVLWE